MDSAVGEMSLNIQTLILRATGAGGARPLETVQQLWGGYGSIVRYELSGSLLRRVVVKYVCLAEGPQGGASGISHRRKLRSYEVERQWYERWAALCGPQCRVPRCLALYARQGQLLLVLEDLDASGFPQRREAAETVHILACLRWLADFHARFLGCPPEGLWEQGTYWHLETRPEELAALADLPLKNAAAAIDRLLRDCPFQTILHGDAKIENFCFSLDGTSVAAVDFQYAGAGCGMKDLAYFIGSCLPESRCEALEDRLLDAYFAELRTALSLHRPCIDHEALEQSWRALYPVAWTDFHRFFKGWSPGGWQPEGYSEKTARWVVRALGF